MRKVFMVMRFIFSDAPCCLSEKNGAIFFLRYIFGLEINSNLGLVLWMETGSCPCK